MAHPNRVFDSSSDDDSVSLASTVSEDYDKHYELDAIVAERSNEEGKQEYLVKWKGYDETFNTWEPEVNFDTELTLKEWREKKMRMTRDLDRPFDIEGFEARMNRVTEAKALRKARRREKRRRLRIAVPPISLSEDTDLDMRNPSPTTSESGEATPRRKQSTVRPLDTQESRSRPPVQRTPQAPSISSSTTWTDHERRAFESGMKVASHNWTKILDLYGARGRINDDLKLKTTGDLQRMASSMRTEFEALGRHVPDWLRSDGVIRSEERSERIKKVQSPKSKKVDRPSARRNPPERSSEGEMDDYSLFGTPIPDYEDRPSAYKGTARRDADAVKQSTGLLLQSRVQAQGIAGDVSNGTNTPTQGAASTAARLAPPKAGNPSGPSPRSDKRGAQPIKFTVNDPQKETARRTRPTAASLPFVTRGKGNHFKSLAVHYHVNKKARTEPAPDFDSLQFLDSSTSRTPKAPVLPIASSRSTDAVPDRSVPEVIERPPSEKPPSEKRPLTRPPSERQPLQNPQPEKIPTESSASFNSLDVKMEEVQRIEDLVTRFEMPSMASSRNPDLGSVPAGERHSLDTPPHRRRSTYSPLFVAGDPRDSAIDSERRKTREDVREKARDEEPLKFHLRNIPTYETKKNLFEYKVKEFHVQGHLLLGENQDDLPMVRLQELDRQLQQRLLTVKVPPTTVHFDLRKQCTALDFRGFYLSDPMECMGSGYVVPYPEGRSRIELLADHMAVALSGALCFSKDFMMVVYPVGATAWHFLEKSLPSVPDGAVLQFAVFPPSKSSTAKEDASYLEEWVRENQSRVEQIKNSAIDGKRNHLNSIFKDIWDVEFKKLMFPNKPSFFLCFTPTGRYFQDMDEEDRKDLEYKVLEEHDLFVDFLKSNNAEIYSMHDYGSTEPVQTGSWVYFFENVQSGTIIIHDSCTRLDQFQFLSRILTRGTLNVWKISLSRMENQVHPHLIRLFPHGGCILLTESLILYQPKEALRLLRWFRLVHLRSKAPETWKLATRPRPRPWLISVLDLYDDSGEDIFNCGKRIFADIYKEIDLLLQTPDSAERPHTTLLDPETPTKDSPLIAAAHLEPLQSRKEWKGLADMWIPDEESIRLNDDELVTWFAGWALRAAVNHRKFTAVIGHESSSHPDSLNPILSRYRRRWCHIESVSADGNVKRHAITPMAQLDRIHIEREKKLTGEVAAVRERLAVATARERDMAKRCLDSIKKIYRDGGSDENVVEMMVERHRRAMGRGEHDDDNNEGEDREAEDVLMGDVAVE